MKRSEKENENFGIVSEHLKRKGEALVEVDLI